MGILVVATHSISQYITAIEVDVTKEDQYILWIRFAILCATPIFILISETLLARNYASGVPKGFFYKRIKFILIPYALVGTVLSYTTSSKDLSSFLEKLKSIVLLGHWHGYFILVIFQFYVLHWLLGKYLARTNPFLPLAAAFLLSFLHSFGFYFIGEYQGLILTHYPLSHRTFILSWVFYFVAGFYIGQYYDQLVAFLMKRIWLPALASISSYLAMMYLVLERGKDAAISERTEMLVFAISVFLLLVVLFRKYKVESNTLMYISNFSFFIYLSHLIVLPNLVGLSLKFGQNFFVFTSMLTFLTISSSMGIAFFLYRNKLTRLFTGKIALLDETRFASGRNIKEKASLN